jgi:hypothetical protein
MSLAVLIATMIISPLSEPCARAEDKVPVIDITDLYHPGQDPGDNLDLVAAYGLPEIDLKAVILDITEVFHNGKWAKLEAGIVPVEQLNYIFDRTVPYGIAPFAKMRSPDDKMLDAPKYQTSGIELMFKVLRESPKKVHILSFGSLRPLAVAWAREPQLMREKVAQVHICAGACLPTEIEWNVFLDPKAMVGILRSDLPIALYPCSAKIPGPGAENVSRLCNGYDSNNCYWMLEHLDFIGQMDVKLQNYLAYSFFGSNRLDFLRAMDDPKPAVSLFMLAKMRHNVWETGVWINVSGRRLVKRQDGSYRIIPAQDVRSSDRVLPNELQPCTLEVLDTGGQRFAITDKPTPYRVYYRGDPKENEHALQEALPELYKSFRPSGVSVK